MTILLALPAAAAQPAAETPRQFMTRALAGYKRANFNPLDHPNRYFAPPLVAAIAEDARLAHGEVGYLDGDPLCQCQDPSDIDPSVGMVTMHGRDRAEVTVLYCQDCDAARVARFSLKHLRTGWRIADVSSADEPSLLGALEKSNLELRAKPRH